MLIEDFFLLWEEAIRRIDYRTENVFAIAYLILFLSYYNQKELILKMFDHLLREFQD